MRLNAKTLGALVVGCVMFAPESLAQRPYIPPRASLPTPMSPSISPSTRRVPRAPPDKAFYQRALAPILRSVETGRDVQWTASGRSGTVFFEELADARCRNFILRETQDGVITERTTMTGQACRASDTAGDGYVITQISHVVQYDVVLDRVEPLPRFDPLPPSERPAPVITPAPRAPPRTRGLTATPVIVEIDRLQPRNAANGGSAVVLLSFASPDVSARNRVICREVWTLMDTATTAQVRVGLRRGADGTIEALRPLYWMSATPSQGARSCESRLANYDYERARIIRDKYGLPGDGPYFLVTRADEQAAAVIDLAGRSEEDVKDLVRYFRDGFAFQNDIWDPARNARKRDLLVNFFGAGFRETLVTALGFVSSPAARAGCRLGDLGDAPCT